MLGLAKGRIVRPRCPPGCHSRSGHAVPRIAQRHDPGLCCY
jgi:hypothetical protein